MIQGGLRFCMPTTFYPPYSFGGDAIVVQRLARALVRRGHEVTVVTDVDAYEALAGRAAARAEASDDDEGVKVVRLRGRFGKIGPLLVQQLGRPVVHARALRRMVSDQRWDVVHFHNVSLVGGPGILRYPRGAVTLYTAHEHWLVCPTHVLWRHKREPCPARQCLRCTFVYRRPPQLWRYTGTLRRALDRVDVVFALSEFSRQKHAEFGLRREMEVLPPFVERNEPAAPSSAPKTPPHHRPYFFYAGRLERMKGLDDVIAAFGSYPDADFLIAGTGMDAAALASSAAHLENVRFLGWLDPAMLREYYRHALATIVPSLCYETFGVVMLEAFREGSPVIARRRGPLPETLERARAGELFDSTAELVAAMARVQRDVNHRARLRTAATTAFNTWWTEEAVVPAYLSAIERAAARRGRDIAGRPPAAAGAVTH